MKPVIVSKYYYERVPQSTLIQKSSEYKFDVWCCGGMNVGGECSALIGGSGR